MTLWSWLQMYFVDEGLRIVQVRVLVGDCDVCHQDLLRRAASPCAPARHRKRVDVGERSLIASLVLERARAIAPSARRRSPADGGRGCPAGSSAAAAPGTSRSCRRAAARWCAQTPWPSAPWQAAQVTYVRAPRSASPCTRRTRRVVRQRRDVGDDVARSPRRPSIDGERRHLRADTSSSCAPPRTPCLKLLQLPREVPGVLARELRRVQRLVALALRAMAGGAHRERRLARRRIRRRPRLRSAQTSAGCASQASVVVGVVDHDPAAHREVPDAAQFLAEDLVGARCASA